MDFQISKGRKLGSHFSIEVTSRLWSRPVHYGTQLPGWAAPTASQSTCAQHIRYVVEHSAFLIMVVDLDFCLLMSCFNVLADFFVKFPGI